nr:hypothetical protein [Tanacetum cinerariifolium]
MDEFDKFAAKEGESLEYVYERLTTLVNIVDRNNVCPILVSINTKFLNCLQPEWSKYVTMDMVEMVTGMQGENRNQAFNTGNVNDESQYARDCQKPRVRDAKYFREQMLLAMKDEAGSNLNAKENDFMLDNYFGDEILEELTTAAVNEINASYKAHEQVNHVKCKTIIQASNDDQIDSNIIFDDPYVGNNGGTFEHDSNDHNEYHNI